MTEECVNGVCLEKFRNIEKEITDLKAQTASLKQKTDENENGRLINQVQLMFNNAAQNTTNENQRRDAEKIRADEKLEKAAEKQSILITKISEDLNRFGTKMDNLESKIGTLECKVDKNQGDQEDLAKRVDDGERKTTIDTSLATKWVLGIAGSAVVIAITAFILKFFKIY